MEEQFISKRVEIEEIVKKLKTHIYNDEFFVDPDKTCISLLKKIIVLLFFKLLRNFSKKTTLSFI